MSNIPKLFEYQPEEPITIPVLVGEKLVLRPCVAADLPAVMAYRTDPANSQYIGNVDDKERVQQIVAQHSSPWRLESGRWNGIIMCEKSVNAASVSELDWQQTKLVVSNESTVDSTLHLYGDLVGEIVFRIDDWENQRAEIGYRLSPKYTGNGYCTEAVKLLVSYLFKHFELHKVIARCDPRNIASYRVMEKVGMVREAHFHQHFLVRGEWTDQLDYSVIRENWRY
ncbi:GNAT family N-acetyltransferase [Aliikangiella maris]|uniref:GNAT family protein n=2 Tax=Aliikangiella maris TaxID=3162458 RepID=A0ABV3MIZ3_9GAMM